MDWIIHSARMNNRKNSEFFAEINFFSCIFCEFGYFCTHSRNSGFFSSKFRREIAFFIHFLRMIEWIIIHLYSFFPKLWRVFCWKIGFWAVQRNVNLVDLEKCWKMSIWLQKSASIQPRTSLSKFGENEHSVQSTP